MGRILKRHEQIQQKHTKDSKKKMQFFILNKIYTTLWISVRMTSNQLFTTFQDTYKQHYKYYLLVLSKS